MDITATLDHLGVTLQEYAGPDLMVRSPIDGAPMASLRCHTHAEVEACIAQAVEAFLVWRTSLPRNAASSSVSSVRRCGPARSPSLAW